MVTNYVLYNEFTRMFIRAGRGVMYTLSLNNAKHFTSEWSANQFKNKIGELSSLTVKKIQRY